jgi:DNA-binding MarR family transcriptional regulator
MDSLADSLVGQASLLSELVDFAIAPRLEELGLSHRTFALLGAVRATDGLCTQADLARRLGITPPSLTEALQAANRNGFVEQTADAKDARAKRVRLTPKGRTTLSRAASAIVEVEAKLIDALPGDAYRNAVSTLRAATKVIAQSE